MIDPKFKNNNTLFVLSFKNGYDDPTRDSFSKYYMSLVEIKYFSTLTDNKPFFDQPVEIQTRSVLETWCYVDK